jgi:hypothetical protein
MDAGSIAITSIAITTTTAVAVTVAILSDGSLRKWRP